MTTEDIMRLVGGLGFPIVVALWLLYRTDTVLRELTRAIQELTKTLIGRL